MKCLHPILIKNPHDNKHHGLLPGETKYIYVPCQHCIACQAAKAKEWTVRMLHESESWNGKCCFITLTFDEEHCPREFNYWSDDKGQLHGSYVPTLKRELLKDYFKRLRKKANKRYGKDSYYSIKQFSCGEYGEQSTLRCHFHSIIFGLDWRDLDIIQGCWPYGHVKFGTLDVKSIRYVAGYVEKKLNEENFNDPFKYCIREPQFKAQGQGLGQEYALKHETQLRQQEFVTVNGNKNPIPRYYLKKLDWQISGFKTIDEHLESVRKQMLDDYCSAQRELNMRSKNSLKNELKKLRRSYRN